MIATRQLTEALWLLTVFLINWGQSDSVLIMLIMLCIGIVIFQDATKEQQTKKKFIQKRQYKMQARCIKNCKRNRM